MVFWIKKKFNNVIKEQSGIKKKESKWFATFLGRGRTKFDKSNSLLNQIPYNNNHKQILKLNVLF